MDPIIRMFVILLSILTASIASAADYPTPTEGDFTIHDFKFQSGETLPELRIHYRTLGKPEKDAQGKTTNAVLVMHGTPAAARNLFALNLPASCLEKISRSTRQNFSSCCRTGLATANRASRATACTQNSRVRLSRHGGGGLPIATKALA
jgi:Homoserine acetyltransferase